MGISPGDLLYSMLPDKALRSALRRIIGVYPRNIELYKKALKHRSVAENQNDHNERLEYLGDSIFGAVVTEFLFHRFPYKPEGFLTQMRSRIVNRTYLNQISRKIGLPELIEFQGSDQERFGSLHGDTFEALIGALFLDRGYDVTRKFIISRLFRYYIDVEQVENTDPDFKSRLINWAQREKHELKLSARESGKNRDRTFHVEVVLNGEHIATGMGPSKKKAEQHACEQVWAKLGLEGER